MLTAGASINDVIDEVINVVNEGSGNNSHYISNREKKGGGKKKKDVSYCDKGNDFEEYSMCSI